MIYVKLRNFLVIAVCLLVASSAKAQTREITERTRKATVLIGGCSGVILDSEGLLLTAKHCKHKDGVLAVLDDGRKIPARHVTSTKSADGPAIYDLDGSGFDGIGIAQATPRFGQQVFSWGFPHGRREYGSGRIVRTVRVEGGVAANECSFRIDSGWSGGPLLTAEFGEVIGCALATDGSSSFWCGWKETRRVYAEALKITQGQGDAIKGLPQLVVFHAAGCIPCRQLEQALPRLTQGRFTVERVDTADRSNLFLASFQRRFPRWDGRVPVCWRWGADSYITGYPAAGLELYLGAGFRCPPSPRPEPLPQPNPQPSPPLPQPSPDMEGIRQEISELRSLIQAIPRGQDGAPGLPGERGPQGPPGKDAPATDITAIQSQLTEIRAALNRPITVESQLSDGKIQRRTFQPGEPIRLYMTPVKKSP